MWRTSPPCAGTLFDLLEVGTSDLPAIFSWAGHQFQKIALPDLLQRRRRNNNHLFGLISWTTLISEDGEEVEEEKEEEGEDEEVLSIPEHALTKTCTNNLRKRYKDSQFLMAGQVLGLGNGRLGKEEHAAPPPLPPFPSLCLFLP
jgi:hypothetical protein